MSCRRGSYPEWKQAASEDLALTVSALSSLSSAISGALNGEQRRNLWRAYVSVEKAVAFVKLELGEESPGRFVKQRRYSIPDERQAVGFALGHLRRGMDALRSGDLAASLGELREARNYLRVLLKRVQRERLKSGART